MGQSTAQTATVHHITRALRSGEAITMPLIHADFACSAPVPFPADCDELKFEFLPVEEKLTIVANEAYTRGIKDGSKNVGQWFTAGCIGGALVAFLAFGAFPTLVALVLPAPAAPLQHEIITR